MTNKKEPSKERPKGNPKFKSSVFASYFSETNQRLIDLYNAFSNAEYPADTPLEINTLTNALFYGLVNDISFVLDDTLIVLTEHQSTYNPNMPFRILLYIAEILRLRYEDPAPFYKPKLQKIENIRCFVLYNGIEDQPDKCILKLSDAYKKAINDIGDPELNIQLELIVPVYNINLGKNPEILAKCNTLHEYSQFIAKVNEGLAAGKTLTQAIKAAIKYCRDHNIMAEYLKTHEAEVRNMLMQEFKTKDIARVNREAGREEGREEGVISVARNALVRGMPIADIAEITGLTREEVDHLRMMNS